MIATVGIIDHQLCNIDSIQRAVAVCGATTRVVRKPAELDGCERLILPGVGAFPDAMKSLTALDLVEPIREAVGEGRPILGICLGMQLLATRGHEGEATEGLGLLPADVLALEPQRDERIPHVGWNEIEPVRDTPLLSEIPAGSDFYFVHSYHVSCGDARDAVATTPYAGGFVSVVGREHVWGVQFHPEKSQGFGLQLLRNFISRC